MHSSRTSSSVESPSQQQQRQSRLPSRRLGSSFLPTQRRKRPRRDAICGSFKRKTTLVKKQNESSQVKTYAQKWRLSDHLSVTTRYKPSEFLIQNLNTWTIPIQFQFNTSIAWQLTPIPPAHSYISPQRPTYPRKSKHQRRRLLLLKQAVNGYNYELSSDRFRLRLLLASRVARFELANSDDEEVNSSVESLNQILRC